MRLWSRSLSVQQSFEGWSMWLNLAGRWFAELTEKQIRRGVQCSTRELENAIRRFIDHPNQHPKPFVWTKSADQILESAARFCKRTFDSVHQLDVEEYEKIPATADTISK